MPNIIKWSWRVFVGLCWGLVILIIFSASAWAYHEFKVPKKAFMKVTIEHYSNAEQKTSPDSTVVIYYDKNDVEMHREVTKGCGNVVGGIDSLSVYQGTAVGIWAITDDLIDTTNFRSVLADSASWDEIEADITTW